MHRKIVLWGLMSMALLIMGSPAFAQYGIFDNAVDWYSPDNPRGTTKVAGSVVEEDGIYTIEGNGDDIWGNDDEGFFVYTEKTGDWRLSARVSWIDPGANEWAKIGVSIRNKPAMPESSHYSLDLRGADYGDQIDAQWRVNEGGGSSDVQIFEDAPDNTIAVEATGDGIWLRVTRVSAIGMFLSEYSYDGDEWIIAHSTTIDGWADSVAYGLAITNHDDNDFLAIAEVDNVVLEEAPPITNITRSLDAITFVGGQTVNAALDIFYSGGSATDLTITETVPAGFVISDISDGGTDSGGVITWNYSANPGASKLTYKVTAPADYDPSVTGYGAKWSGGDGSSEIKGPSNIYYFNLTVGEEIFSFDFDDASQYDDWEDLAGFWDVNEDGYFVEYEDAGGPLVSLTGDPDLTDIAITVQGMGFVADADWGIVFRGTDINNFYSWQFVNAGLDMILYSGGTRSELHAEDYDEVLNVWQKFQVIIKGNVFYLLFDDEIHAVVEDDTHAAGQVGLFGWVNAGTDVGDTGGIAFDNFVVSSVVENTSVGQWSLY